MQTHGARKIEDLSDPKTTYPIGVIGLCAVSVSVPAYCSFIVLTIYQVECAYLLWQTRTITSKTIKQNLPLEYKSTVNLPKPAKGVSMKKAKSTQFCHTICGSHQTDYTDSAKNIKAAQWEKIIQAARRYARISRKVPTSSVEVIMDSDDDNHKQSFNPHTNLVEAESSDGGKDDDMGDGKVGDGTKDGKEDAKEDAKGEDAEYGADANGKGNSRDNDGEVGKESEDSEESKESEDGP